MKIFQILDPNSPWELKAREYANRVKGGESKESILNGLPNTFKNRINELLLETSNPWLLSISEKRKLRGWPASYELAKVAISQGVDLSILTREDYVDFAITNYLQIDDDQLRMNPWQRMSTSVNDIVQKTKIKRAWIHKEIEQSFTRFSYEILEKAATEERYIQDGIKIRSGTKDSESWLFFWINTGVDTTRSNTYKAYIALKDLNTVSPENFIGFMAALRNENYNWDVKIFQDLSEQAIYLNDQIVMHGASRDDAEVSLSIAKKYFWAKNINTSFWKDEFLDGKSLSYSQILAKKIENEINSK